MLKELTVEDFLQHFTELFFDENSTKRLDFQLNSLKHSERQVEWTGKNEQSEQLTHVHPSKRVLSTSGTETFKK